ncbi:hypothetical protein [Lewinella sp. W8]|uniref:hypothetical protein n=1 Tax=Lewinella sp. W8 TaxID=2528208 RepID=UPI00106889D0|nr:hypothetical protein [Lewinella sp. W8]MTB52094.1 hypothetical protein [Lewinella sp. W8]
MYDTDLLFPQAILIIIHLGLTLLVLFLFYRLLRKVFRGIFRNIFSSRVAASILLISLGITAVFFKSLFFDSVSRIGNFLLLPFENISVLNGFFDGNPGLNEALLKYLSSWAQSISSSVYQNVFSLDYRGLIIFSAVWLGLAFLLEKIFAESEDVSPVDDFNFFDRPAVKQVISFLIIIFSIYLCVASIIAVPEFQSRKLVVVEKDYKEKYVKVLNDQTTDYDKSELIIDFKGDSLKVEDDYRLVNLHNNIVINLENFNAQVERNWSNDEKIKQIVLNRYSSAVEQNTLKRDRIDYGYELADWYSINHQTWIVRTQFSRSRYLDLVEGYRLFVHELRESKQDTSIYQRYYESNGELNDHSIFRISIFRDQLEEYRRGVKYGANDRFDIYSIPGKPVIGEKYGIFNAISGWLLRTESTSLALIVGLFGFGLLGAIGALFIRKRISEGPMKETIVGFDVPGILINGLSAAIVVFLAAKGTVAIFSTASADLNPYVVFFTCLIAAVFSEDVWAWARTKLNDSLNAGWDQEE